MEIANLAALCIHLFLLACSAKIVYKDYTTGGNADEARIYR